jgi:hypothetical protein
VAAGSGCGIGHTSTHGHAASMSRISRHSSGCIMKITRPAGPTRSAAAGTKRENDSVSPSPWSATTSTVLPCSPCHFGYGYCRNEWSL